MSFTDEERRAWHDAKRQRETRPQVVWRSEPVTECIRCGLPLGFGEGYISEEVSLCDVCNGD